MGWSVQAQEAAERGIAFWSWMESSRTLLKKCHGSLEQTRCDSMDWLLGKKMWEMGLKWKTEKSLEVSP